jgi:hypothetical protein
LPFHFEQNNHSWRRRIIQLTKLTAMDKLPFTIFVLIVVIPVVQCQYPGGRTGAMSWINKEGNAIWLFGGYGNDVDGNQGRKAKKIKHNREKKNKIN